MRLMINDMDMPKNCLLCPCCVGEGIGMGRQHYCQAINDEPWVSENYRPENCPLSEIPTPHGRLIDADKAAVAILMMSNHPCGHAIENISDVVDWLKIKDNNIAFPTIIEAED